MCGWCVGMVCGDGVWDSMFGMVYVDGVLGDGGGVYYECMCVCMYVCIYLV